MEGFELAMRMVETRALLMVMTVSQTAESWCSTAAGDKDDPESMGA